MQPHLFLKRVLLLDAASCLGMGILLAAGAGPLAPLLGLGSSLLLGAGAVLVPIGLFILWTGARRTHSPRKAPRFIRSSTTKSALSMIW